MAQVHAVRAGAERMLVVYCSRDGHTRRIAGEIAAACHAEIEEITPVADRSGMLGYLRCAVESVLGIPAGVRAARQAPQAYGLVVIGTPVWFWSIASPVRRYLQTHRHELGRVAFFCTYGGSGQNKVLQDLEHLSGQAPVATLALTTAACQRPSHRQEVRRFVHALSGAGRHPTPGEGAARTAAGLHPGQPSKPG